MTTPTMVPVSKIRMDAGTQTRVATRHDVVDEYAEAADKLPPVVLFTEDDENYFPGDGFHRVPAFVKAGWMEIPADVRKGGQREALLFSAGCNDAHGLRRTPDDKRRAVTMLLSDEEWGKASDRWIAEKCRVSDHFVAKVRSEFKPQSAEDNGNKGAHVRTCGDQDVDLGGPKPGKRIGKDQRSYPPHPKLLSLKCENCTAKGLKAPDCPACVRLRDAAAKKIADDKAEAAAAAARKKAEAAQKKADQEAAREKERLEREAKKQREKDEREAKKAQEAADRQAEKKRKAAEKEAEQKAKEEAERAAAEQADGADRDGWGIPIQDHAMAAFEARPLFDELLKVLRRADQLYSKLAEHEGGAYLRRPGISVNARDRWKHNGLKTAILNVTDCRPTYTVCPYAHSKAKNYTHGDDCTLCHGLNWVRQLGKTEIAEELVEAVKGAFHVRS